jgi:hypothetical protein
VNAQHQVELFLREIGVDHTQWNHVKGQIPRGVPGILSFVVHRGNVVVVHVYPVAVAHPPAFRMRQLAARAMLGKPAPEVMVEILFGPEHAG